MSAGAQPGWPVGIHTYSYIWTLSARDTLAHLADQGYRLVELLVNRPHLWPEELDAGERRTVAKLLSDRGLRVEVLNPPSLDLNLVSPSPQMRAMTRAHYRGVIELAADWGVPWVLVVPGKTHPLLPAPSELVWGWFEEAVTELDRLAEDRGLGIVLENIPMAFLPTADGLMQAIDRLGNDRLGICYDAANATFIGESPGAGLRRAAPRVKVVHLSDTGLARWDHACIGTGVVKCDEVAAAMRETGLQVPTMLEIISDRGDEDIRASHAAIAELGWEPVPGQG